MVTCGVERVASLLPGWMRVLTLVILVCFWYGFMCLLCVFLLVGVWLDGFCVFLLLVLDLWLQVTWLVVVFCLCLVVGYCDGLYFCYGGWVLRFLGLRFGFGWFLVILFAVAADFAFI